MTARPVSLSGAIEINVDRAARRLAQLVVDELVARGVAVQVPSRGAAFPVSPAPTTDSALGDDRGGDGR